jgi:hypothetical protein
MTNPSRERERGLVKRLAILAGLALCALMSPTTALGVTTTTSSMSFQQAVVSDCDSVRSACSETRVELASNAPGTPAEVCLTISYGTLIDPEIGYEFGWVESGCATIDGSQYSFGSQLEGATIGPVNDLRVDLCEVGGGPETCISSRLVDLAVSLSATTSRLSPGDERSVFRTRDGRCVTIYQQEVHSYSVVGSITLDGVSQATTSGFLTSQAQTVHETCD